MQLTDEQFKAGGYVQCTAGPFCYRAEFEDLASPAIVSQAAQWHADAHKHEVIAYTKSGMALR